MLLITIFVELHLVDGRSRMWAVVHRPSLDGRAVPWPWEERRGQSMAWSRHGHGVANVNQKRPHCVNQTGKTYFKPLATRHGRGTTWVRQGHGMLCVNRPLEFSLPKPWHLQAFNWQRFCSHRPRIRSSLFCFSTLTIEAAHMCESSELTSYAARYNNAEGHNLSNISR